MHSRQNSVDRQTERHSLKGFSCNISQSGHWCRTQQTLARCPTDRCCGTYILAVRADSRPSLQVRGGSASKARADIHIAEELSFFLHRRKAAWSPLCQMLRTARTSALHMVSDFHSVRHSSVGAHQSTSAYVCSDACQHDRRLAH